MNNNVTLSNNLRLTLIYINQLNQFKIMKTVKISKSKLLKVIIKSVSALKKAPLTNCTEEKISIYLDRDSNKIKFGIIGNWGIPSTTNLCKFNYVFPTYEDSQNAMKECKIRITENNIKKWDWENFVSSNDFNNMVYYIYMKCLDFIDRELNNNNDLFFAIVD